MSASDPATPPSPEDPSGRSLPSREATELVAGIALLTESRLPLSAGLRALADETPHRRLRQLYADLAARLESGAALQEAFEELGDRVPAHLRGLLCAGIEAGRLGDVVAGVVQIQTRASRLQKRLWQSLAYPLLLLCMLVVIVYVIKTFALEGLVALHSDVFADWAPRQGKSWSLPIRLLLYMPSIDAPALWGLLAGFLVLALCMRRLTTPAFRHRVLAGLPLVGPMWRYSSLAELLRLLATLLAERLPLPKALELSAASLSDRDLAGSCRGLQRVVEAGGSLADGFNEERRLPRTLAPLLEWGVQSGTLTDVLCSAADMYAARAESQANLARTILPPLIFLLILAVIGALMFGMYSAVIQLIHQLAI